MSNSTLSNSTMSNSTMSATQAASLPADDAAAEPQSGRDFIRNYDSKDRRAVEQLVGQGYMEGLAQANKKVYLSPPVILGAITLGLALNFLMGIHKVPVNGPLHYAQYLIGPCVILLPLLAGIEWIQRPAFDHKLRSVIEGWDMVSLERYYTADTQSMSGAWVFEHKDEVVGVVMLDARSAGKELGSVVEGSADVGAVPAAASAALDPRGGDLRNRKPASTSSKSASTTAEIRHLDVRAVYRRHGVGTELLGAALDTAFGLTPGNNEANDVGKQATVTRVIALAAPFTPGGDALWSKMGFVRVPEAEVAKEGWRTDKGVGLKKWAGHWVAVEREGWLAARDNLYSRFAPAAGMEQGEGRDVLPDGSMKDAKPPVPPM